MPKRPEPKDPAVPVHGPAMPAGWQHPDVEGDTLSVDQFPSTLLVGTATLIQRHLTRAALEPHGIGVPEWRLLAFLALHGPTSASAMTPRMWMDKAQISRALKSLTERGLVRREADPAHGKRLMVQLSTKGRRLHARALVSTRRQQVLLLQALSTSERVGLHAALSRLRGLAEAAAAAEVAGPAGIVSRPRGGAR